MYYNLLKKEVLFNLNTYTEVPLMKKYVILIFMVLLFTAMVFAASSSPKVFDKKIKVNFIISLGCQDSDNDGYGKSGHSFITCRKSAALSDCNDNNIQINPGAKEVCENKVDDNCNRKVDEDKCITIKVPKMVPVPPPISPSPPSLPLPSLNNTNHANNSSNLAVNISQCHPERLSLGSMEWGEGKNNTKMMITAPHGTFDIRTGLLVKKIMNQYSTNYVIANNYQNSTHRVNVNRPTEGFKGKSITTERAIATYTTFKNCVDEYPSQYYIEIHGNSNPKIKQEIQVATIGLGPVPAQKLVDSFNLYKQGKLDNYELKIEPLHKIGYNAGQNKKIGMLSHCDTICLHLELPRSLRTKEMLPVTADVLILWLKDLDHLNLTKATSEICDNLDNDADGQVDEGCESDDSGEAVSEGNPLAAADSVNESGTVEKERCVFEVDGLEEKMGVCS